MPNKNPAVLYELPDFWTLPEGFLTSIQVDDKVWLVTVREGIPNAV